MRFSSSKKVEVIIDADADQLEVVGDEEAGGMQNKDKNQMPIFRPPV
jgi:hypothetical protein